MKAGINRVVVALGAAALLFPLGTTAAVAQKPAENTPPRALVDRALAAADIETASSPAFRLEARFRINYSPDNSVDGQLLRVWTPVGWWHDEQQMPGYQSIRVSDGKVVWSAGNLDYVPFSIFLIERALEPGGELRAARAKTLDSPVPSADGAGVCIRTAGDSDMFQYCFDPQSGNLVRLFDGIWDVNYEYSDYQAFGPKRFPRTIRILRTSGRVFAEIHIDRLVPIPDPDLSIFLPVSGSKESAAPGQCAAIEPPKLEKMVRPGYPKAAEKAGIIGVVRLYAEIGADGVPRGLWPVNSVPPVLSKAAIKAVSQWRYRPRTCKTDGRKMSVVVQITALFVSR